MRHFRVITFVLALVRVALAPSTPNKRIPPSIAYIAVAKNRKVHVDAFHVLIHEVDYDALMECFDNCLSSHDRFQQHTSVLHECLDDCVDTYSTGITRRILRLRILGFVENLRSASDYTTTKLLSVLFPRQTRPSPNRKCGLPFLLSPKDHIH